MLLGAQVLIDQTFGLSFLTFTTYFLKPSITLEALGPVVLQASLINVRNLLLNLFINSLPRVY